MTSAEKLMFERELVEGAMAATFHSGGWCRVRAACTALRCLAEHRNENFEQVLPGGSDLGRSVGERGARPISEQAGPIVGAASAERDRREPEGLRTPDSGSERRAAECGGYSAPAGEASISAPAPFTDDQRAAACQLGEYMHGHVWAEDETLQRIACIAPLFLPTPERS